MSALARLAALFLEPAEPRPLPASARASQLTAVLAPAPDLLATAGGIAVAARRAANARTAIVVHAAPLVARVATPGAAGLARRMSGRGVDAAAAGALCHVELPVDPAGALAQAQRVT